LFRSDEASSESGGQNSSGQQRSRAHVEGQQQQGQTGIDYLTVQTPPGVLISTIRAHFQAAGVILDPPKSVLLNNRLGMLMVRATLADHDLIEQVIQEMTRRHDRIEEAAQAVTAGFPATNTDVGGARAETAKTPSPASKPLPSTSVDLRAAPPPELHTRWFKVDPITFMHGLQGFMGQDVGRSKDVVKAAGAVQTPEEIVSATVRTYFQTIGVTLDPPKSISLNDRLGMLQVRATLSDLDLIEQAVQVLNMAPPQVVIEVKFCELPEESLKALGFNWLLGPAASDPLGAQTEPRLKAGGSQSSVDSDHRNQSTNASLTSLKGILTPQQFAVVLRALGQRRDTDIVTLPKVLTQTGRPAQIKAVNVRTIVTGLDLTTNAPAAPGQPAEHPPITKQFELGPCLDVVPYVAADGRTIQMTVIPTIKEFIGYDVDYAVSKGIWDYVASPGASPPISQMYPLPIFRLRQLAWSASVKDGQTLVLASPEAKSGVPDSHLANKLPKELAEQLSASIQRMQKPPQKTMLVFITPTIVDAAGNRVHTEADLPARTNSVPSQLPPDLK
jgi:hypothetical protein